MMNLLYIIPSALAGAFLGAWAGAHGTNLAWRRYGIPGLFILNAGLALHSPWVICLMAMAGIFSLGYGVPDESDDGSSLGQFWYKITGQSHFWTDVFTRGTVGVGVVFVFLLIAILKQNWLIYGLCGAGIVANYIAWGAIVQNEGEIEIFGKKLLKEDIYVYLGVMILGMMIIWI